MPDNDATIPAYDANRNLPAEVTRFKKWANDNYNNGADMFVECYTNADLTEFLQESTDYAEAIEHATILCEISEERHTNARIITEAETGY